MLRKLTPVRYAWHSASYQVEVTKGTILLQGQDILLQGHEIQRELGDVHIPDDTGLLEDGVAYEGPSRDPEDEELMLHTSVPLQALDMLCEEDKCQLILMAFNRRNRERRPKGLSLGYMFSCLVSI